MLFNELQGSPNSEMKEKETGLRDTHDNKKLLQLSMALEGYNLLLMLCILRYVLSVLDEHLSWSFLANKSKSSDGAALVVLHHH